MLKTQTQPKINIPSLNGHLNNQNYYPNNSLATPVAPVKDHKKVYIDKINKGLAKVESGVNYVDSGVSYLNKNADEAKRLTAKTLNDVSGWAWNSVSNGLENIFGKLDRDDLKSSSDALSVVIDSYEKPFLRAANILNKFGEQSVRNAGVSAVNIATDVAGTIPGLGAAVEAAKLVTDLTKMTRKGVSIARNTVDTYGDIVDESGETIKRALEMVKLENLGNVAANVAANSINNNINNGFNSFNNSVNSKMNNSFNSFDNAATNMSNRAVSNAINNLPISQKIKGGGFKDFSKEKAQIGGRISDSIAAFTDPIGYQSILKGGGGGKNKTNRMVKRNNAKNRKSRRVRFSL